MSRAVSTAASAARTAATLFACALVRLSNSSREMACTFTSFSARATSRCGQVGGGARLLELGLRPLQLGLVRPAVDLEQHLALPDLSPLRERHPLDVARHARPDLDLVDRLESAAELVPLGDVRAGAPGRRVTAGGGGAAGGFWTQPSSEPATHRALTTASDRDGMPTSMRARGPGPGPAPLR